MAPGKRCAKGTRHTGFYDANGARKCSKALSVIAKAKVTKKGFWSVKEYPRVKSKCARGFRQTGKEGRTCRRKPI